ncbi:hypothetical protein, partial [Streptomyces mirabilis]
DRKSALQHADPTLAGKAVAVRDQQWTYVWRLYEEPELYARGEDPHERVNLAGRSEHAAVQQRMHDAMLRWLVETADVIPTDADPRLPAVDLPVPGAAARRDTPQS